MQIPSELVERIGVRLHGLNASDSEATMTAYVRSRAEPQSTMQSAPYTEEMALRAYKSAGSGLRPAGNRMRSAKGTSTSSSNVKGSSNQS